MDFSSLPTDNLYVFIFLSGLVSLYFFINQKNKKDNEFIKRSSELKESTAKTNLEQELLEAEISNAKESMPLKMKLLELKYGFESLLNNPSEELKSEEVRLKYIGYLNEYIELGIGDSIVELSKKSKKNMHTNRISELKLEELKKIKTDYENLNRYSPYVYLVCFSMMLFGIIFWYTKHQYYQDRILELEYNKYAIELVDSSKNKDSSNNNLPIINKPDSLK